MSRVGGFRPRNTLGTAAYSKSSPISQKAPRFIPHTAESRTPDNRLRRRSNDAVSAPLKRTRAISIEDIDADEEEDDIRPLKRRRPGTQRAVPGDGARNGSADEEDVLAKGINPVVRISSSPCPPKLSEQAPRAGHLPRGFGETSFSTVEKTMDTKGYPRWAESYTVQEAGKRKGRRPPGVPTDIVETKTIILPGATSRSTTLASSPLDKQDTELSQPISISSDRSPTATRKRCDSEEAVELLDSPQPKQGRAPGPLGAALRGFSSYWPLKRDPVPHPQQNHSENVSQHSKQASVDLTGQPATNSVQETPAVSRPLRRSASEKSFPLYSYRRGNIRLESENLELKALPGRKQISVHLDRPLPEEVIDMTRIAMITASKLGEDTRMILVQSRRIGMDSSNDPILLHCKSEKDYAQLLHTLQESSHSRMVVKPKDHFRAAFENYGSGKIHHENVDVQLAQRNQQKRRSTDQPEEAPIKRQRQSPSKLLKGLQAASGQRPPVSSPHGDGSVVGKRRTPSRPQHEEGSGFLMEASDFLPKESISSRTRRASTRRSLGNGYASPKEPKREPVVPYSTSHGLGNPWKRPLTFPKEGKHKATVDFDDLLRLDEEEFLNDSLIQFYLRYLQDNMERDRPEAAKRVYWFNSYFYATLTSGVKGRQGINFNAVKRWTRNIDLFQYDYVIVPINEAAHWYLVILCNLPALLRTEAETNNGTADDGKAVRFDELLETMNHSSGEPCTKWNARESLCTEESQVVEVPAPDFHKLTEAAILLPDGEEHTVADLGSARTKSEAQDPHPDADSVMREASPSFEILPDVPKSAIEESFTESLNQSEPSLVLLDRDAPQDQFRRRSQDRKRRAPVRLYDPSEPAIVTLDSLGQTHPSAHRALKNYLVEEALDKKGSAPFSNTSIKGMNAQGIPQQQNFCDCGLFLLGYMDKFSEDPKEFVTKILRKEFDVSQDWPKLQPSALRHRLRSLLFNLYEDDLLVRRDKMMQKQALPKISDDAGVSPPQPTLQVQVDEAVTSEKKQPALREDDSGQKETHKEIEDASWKADLASSAMAPALELRVSGGCEMIVDSQGERDRPAGLQQGPAAEVTWQRQDDEGTLQAQLQRAAAQEVVDLVGSA